MTDLDTLRSTYLARVADASDATALEDVRLIDLCFHEASIRRNEIESILAAFAERCRRIANQEAHDAE